MCRSREWEQELARVLQFLAQLVHLGSGLGILNAHLLDHRAQLAYLRIEITQRSFPGLGHCGGDGFPWHAYPQQKEQSGMCLGTFTPPQELWCFFTVSCAAVRLSLLPEIQTGA